MLENLSYPIPTIGRITIGEKRMNEGTGTAMPVRLNHFTVTAQHKRNGEWVVHPIHKLVAKQMQCEPDEITEIPVRLMFNNPDLSLRERRECYDNGRMTCASCGNGNARRVAFGGFETVPCPGHENKCEFAQGSSQGCELMGRLNVQIDVPAEGFRDDPFSSFILRTRGYNTVRTLRSKLTHMAAMFGNRFLGVPFILKLRTKSTQQSLNTSFFYVDLVLATSVKEAIELAKAKEAEMQQDGLDQKAYEETVMNNLMNGPFEDTIEEVVELEDMLIRDVPPSPAMDAPGGNPAETPTPLVSDGQFGLDLLRQMIETNPAVAA